jgi:uncharacterized protein YndB with AHSA1/START domain
MRVGGPFEICMREADGAEHWTRGVFLEVEAPERLVIEMRVASGAGAPLFTAHTIVTFHDEGAGTRIEVLQSYVLADPKTAAPMVAGAPEGWSSTFDRLETEIARMVAGPAPARTVAHGTFTLERTYAAPVARLWAALTDLAAKKRWFTGPPGDEVIEHRMDARGGGRERMTGRMPNGVVHTFDAIYFDVIPETRLVYAYEMILDGVKISASLATMELKPAADGGVTLKVTEQGAFLDGYDDAGRREAGTAFLLDAIGASLAV